MTDWKDKIKNTTETKAGLLHIRFYMSEQDGFAFPGTTDMLILTREAFETAVEYCRRFYSQVSDQEIEKWNNSMMSRLARAESGQDEVGKLNTGYVYLAYAETGQYKIGRSKSPIERIKVFKTKMPIDVTLIHTIPADNPAEAEKELHERYAGKRLGGEWFDLSGSDVSDILAIDRYAVHSFWRE